MFRLPEAVADAEAAEQARNNRTMIPYRFQILPVAAVLLCIAALPAAAQRYAARQDGDVITLADSTAKMNVAVVASLGKAWQIQVKGQNLVRSLSLLVSFLVFS